jgi:hypothetical protein
MKLVGERRALAAAVFAFYFMIMLLQALMAPDPLKPAMYALSGVYGLAFFSLVAGYFWARWYAVGVGIFGLITGVVAIWQLGALEPVFVFFGGTHLFAAVVLWGDKMSEPYEGQSAWRERYHMDDNAVQRLGRSVMRAGVSLPFVLLYGLMPKPEGTASALVVTGLALTGFAGIIKLRTWGVLALSAAGLVAVATGITSGPVASLAVGSTVLTVSPLMIGALLLLAAAPFVQPMRRWIAAR